MSKYVTIAEVLNKNSQAIYALLNNDEIEASRKLVLELLDSSELKGNKDVCKAKMAFNKCVNKPNLYLSTLVTYLTCIKTV